MSSPKRQRDERRETLSLAGLTSSTGILAILVTLFALWLGIEIDNRTGQGGLPVVCILVASVPLNLFLMLKIALWTANKAQSRWDKQPQISESEKEA